MSEADPERILAIAHAPIQGRPALQLLFDLDARLSNIVRTTTEPLIGEMRLVWWRDALAGLGAGDAPAEPLLRELAHNGLDAGLMAAMADGWAELLVPFPIDEAALSAFSVGRGGALFRAAGRGLGVEDFGALEDAGRGWALVDLAFHCSDAETGRRALALAGPLLEKAFVARWPKSVRSLGMIATLALRDTRSGHPPARPGSPARQIAMLRHRLTGR